MIAKCVVGTMPSSAREVNTNCCSQLLLSKDPFWMSSTKVNRICGASSSSLYQAPRRGTLLRSVGQTGHRPRSVWVSPTAESRSQGSWPGDVESAPSRRGRAREDEAGRKNMSREECLFRPILNRHTFCFFSYQGSMENTARGKHS